MIGRRVQAQINTNLGDSEDQANSVWNTIVVPGGLQPQFMKTRATKRQHA